MKWSVSRATFPGRLTNPCWRENPPPPRYPTEWLFFSSCLHPSLENSFLVPYGTSLCPCSHLISRCSGTIRSFFKRGKAKPNQTHFSGKILGWNRMLMIRGRRHFSENPWFIVYQTAALYDAKSEHFLPVINVNLFLTALCGEKSVCFSVCHLS